jgi:predicted ATPase
LNDKSIRVDENGKFGIKSSSGSDLDPRFLSSGEKQILILLTEALLRVDKPVVYIADEPELSLHISWQEKLLESLMTFGEQMQVIVATHSPDIVGKFQNRIIDLGRKI